MKFGKRLRDQVEGTLPEWRNNFLCYKGLKKRLKTCDGTVQEITGEPCDGSSANSGQDAFLRMLDAEVEKLNDFFTEKEEEFVIRLHSVKERIADQASLAPSADNSLTEVTSIRTTLVSLHGEMVLLEHYSSLNYLALVKIVKKHDKHSTRPIQQAFLMSLLHQPFCCTDLISQLIGECDCLLRQLLPTEEPSSYSCSHKGDQPFSLREPCSSSASPIRSTERGHVDDARSTATECAHAASGSPISRLEPESSASTGRQDNTLYGCASEVASGLDELAAMMVYRSACSALHLMFETPEKSRTPHPLTSVLHGGWWSHVPSPAMSPSMSPAHTSLAQRWEGETVF